MAFTRRQRNELFDVLDGEIDHAACDFGVESVPAPADWFELHRLTLRHKPSGSFVEIDQSKDPWGTITISVRSFVTDGPEVHPHDASWDDVLAQAVDWAQEVNYVSETPDLWAELQQVPEILAAAQSAEASNAPFTPDEQAEIARRLDEIKQLVRERFELTDEQLAAIDQRLDDAKETAKHTDRKNWLYMFYGAVMSTFMTDEIPPHVIQTVVTTVLHGIGHIFGIGGPPRIISA